jgi:hypothetical protein
VALLRGWLRGVACLLAGGVALLRGWLRGVFPWRRCWLVAWRVCWLVGRRLMA